ncbi:hypothetical protein WISP_72527 [Willisornis vidua]|uniref:Uncharacterized protein n=1 Tax=Willisornis vidua TaxID=1566151 RepID=A0ABQ9D766_9PASS|nr:hypothetical protein WISP_72527 [Willisornis vidua]
MLVAEKLKVTQQSGLSAQRDNSILDYIKNCVASNLRGVILPLYSALVRPLLEHWCPQYRKDINLLEQIQRRAMNLISGMEHLSYEVKLRKLELLGLKERRLWDDLIAVFQYLKGAYKKDEEGLFARACSDWTRENGFNLKECGFRLDLRKKLFTGGKEFFTGGVW